MQGDLESEYPEVDFQILGINERGHDFANQNITSGRDLPWLQDQDADGDQLSDVWAAWEITYRDVFIVDRDGRALTTYNLTSHDLADSENYDQLKQLFVDAAFADDHPQWQNSQKALDVNEDDFISPLDALLILNVLNVEGAHELTAADSSLPYVDTSGDGLVTPLDALLVINHLNAQSDLDPGEPVAASEPDRTPRISEVGAAIDVIFTDELTKYRDADIRV